MHPSKYWIDQLELQPHPEGGYYKEIYQSPVTIKVDGLAGMPCTHERHLATSIYYLLNSGETSKFHRLKSDELWYFHTGCPMIVYSIDKDGKLDEKHLGLNPENGEVLQYLMPAGTIFGAMPSEPATYSLVGCMVTPGFDFNDFEMFTLDYLLGKYPQHNEIIQRVYHSSSKTQ
jgi:hypothetical protein